MEGTGERVVAGVVEFLFSTRGAQISSPASYKPGVVLRAYSPSTEEEVEAGGLEV